MRVLFASNFFPPATVGGYEMWCHDVAHEFVRRGHDVRVVTGRSDATNEPSTGVGVHRVIDLEVVGGVAQTLARLLVRRRRERRTLGALRALVESFRPEVALAWGMWNVPRAVPAAIEELFPARTAYYLCDYWPTLPNAFLQKLQADSRRARARLIKKVIAAPLIRCLGDELPRALRFEHPVFCSRAVQRVLVQAGIAVAHGRVIPGGVKTEDFAATPRPASDGRSFDLLYVGRITPEKGVRTAVRAVHALRGGPVPVTLHIVGTGSPQYEAELRDFVRASGAGDRVRFAGPAAPEHIPEILSRHHALVFSSEWEEPFARTVLEAMAAGLPVIGTTTGGTGEVLVAGETGLTFPPGDHEALASHVLQLARHPDLGRCLAARARELVSQRFTFRRMVDGLEATLLELARAPRDDAGGPWR